MRPCCLISGIISIKNSLDRETDPEYHLTVTATDGGDLFCHADVYIAVTDVNDNAPVFSEYEYTVMIREDAEVNTLLTRVSASDQDLGLYRKVHFAIQDTDGQFTMDQDSGIISLASKLDRETVARYNLTIFAYDQVTTRTSVCHEHTFRARH